MFRGRFMHVMGRAYLRVWWIARGKYSYGFTYRVTVHSMEIDIPRIFKLWIGLAHILQALLPPDIRAAIRGRLHARKTT
jgi:hypothetical protein